MRAGRAVRLSAWTLWCRESGGLAAATILCPIAGRSGATYSRLKKQIRPRFQPKTWGAFHRQMFGGQRADQVSKELGMPLALVYVARGRVLAALRREAAGIVDSTGFGRA